MSHAAKPLPVRCSAPVSDSQPALGKMTAKVAALVSLSGEDGGAESASLALGTFSLLHGGDWSDYQKVIKLVGEDAVNDSFWKRGTSANPLYVMGEQCRGNECDMNLEARYRSAMHALYNLGTDFMRPSPFQRSAAQTARWKKLQAYVGDPALRWSDIVPPELEADNGVSYISYGARIHNWSPAWGDAFSMDFLFFASIVLTDGANDGYVSTRRQVFANPAANFEHIRTLSGAWWGKGYHHMFFSGRNDRLYAPAARDRDAAPYDGDAAGFYRQMARDLKARGF